MAPIQQRPQEQQTGVQKPPQNLPAIAPPRIPYHPAIEKEFGISRVTWRALTEAAFPSAQTIEGVLLALSYCKARNLDPLKRTIHIVPIWDKNRNRMVESVWPGIGELRTTAHRTGQFVGQDETEFGPLITERFGGVEIEVNEWARVTVWRMVAGAPRKFVGPKVYWRETYSRASSKSEDPNSMWLKRPSGQLEKCATAAALRAAFPEEIGDYIPEEIERSDARPSMIQLEDSQFTTNIPVSSVTQEEQQSVAETVESMKGQTEPETQGKPAEPHGGPPKTMEELEVWLATKFSIIDELDVERDTIVGMFPEDQAEKVLKLIGKRKAAIAKAEQK